MLHLKYIRNYDTSRDINNFEKKEANVVTYYNNYMKTNLTPESLRKTSERMNICLKLI